MPLLYKLPVNHLQYPTMNLDYTVPLSFTVIIIITNNSLLSAQCSLLIQCQVYTMLHTEISTVCKFTIIIIMMTQ